MLIFLSMLDSEEERQIFQKIYEDNYRKMYYVARKIVNGHEMAEDAVQEAFCKLAKHFQRYEGLSGKKMEALCITIAKHQAVDLLREAKHMADADVETLLLYRPDEEHFLEELIEQRDLSLKIKQALEMLPEILKLTLELKYYQELNNREIARLLQLPVKTVEMRLYRGRKKLEELMLWSKQ